MSENSTRIALLGDYDETVTAHRAIPLALALAADSLALEIDFDWIDSDSFDLAVLRDYDALWCVPNSPYRDRDAVLSAIGFARENNLAYLGTCAGFQHAALEFARFALGHAAADSLEDNPDTTMPLLAPMLCRLNDASDAINLTDGSIARGIYQQQRIIEEYNCGFALNPDYLSIFDGSAMCFSGFDDAAGPRILEIPAHRFFLASAFQPERSAFGQQAHPLITAFVQAARADQS